MDPLIKPPATALENFPEQYSGNGETLATPQAGSAPGRQDSVDVIVRDGFAAQPLAIALARHYQLPFKAYLDFSLVDTKLLAGVPFEYAQGTRVLPLHIKGNILVAAVADPSNYGPIDNLATLFRMTVKPVVVPLDILDFVITRLYYGGDPQPTGPLIHLRGENLETSANELSQERMDLIQWDDAPVARILDAVISETIAEGGDRVCFEPFDQELRVRYFAQDKWYDLLSLPKCLEKAVISCVKVMAGLSSTTIRGRQEGRIRLRGRDFDAIAWTLVVPEFFGDLVTLSFDRGNETSPGATVPSNGAQPALDESGASDTFPHCARCGDAIVLADALFCRRCGFRLRSRFRFRDRIRLVQSFLHSASVILHG